MCINVINEVVRPYVYYYAPITPLFHGRKISKNANAEPKRTK
jgi:hypothetical protein